MNLKKKLAEIGVRICKIITFIYDVATFPLYFIIDQPWEHWKLKKIVWAKREKEDDPYSPYVRQVYDKSQAFDARTMNDIFRNAVAEHGDKPCFGKREILGEEEVASKSGKVFKKLTLGEYKWMTYNEADAHIDEVSKGLLSIGVKSRKPLVLLAETRMEWIITAQACFRVNIPVVTLYATLGEEGFVHGINETEVTHVITSVELLPKLKKVFGRTPRVTHVVYMEGTHPPDTDGIPDRIQLMSFSELSETGKAAADYSYDPPVPEDLGILMYTSGSTGIPKGAMISNKCLVNTTKGLINDMGKGMQQPDDSYVAYLPLAHVLELCAECFLSALGVRIGFSTPQTLTDFSTAVKIGCKGDLRVLQPTLMVAVPLMLDRIRKSILSLAGPEGTYSRLMFDFAIEYKRFWMHRGFQTKKLDRYLLKTYSDFFGGKLRIVLCGSAPVSPDTQDFVRTCLSVRVVQGYGMTETSACSTVPDLDDFSTGRVGAPLSTIKIRLVDWDEGGYHVTDVPYPRGEVVIGGDSVIEGYFKREQLTEETFKRENGMWWVYSGDIGQVYPDGTFKIIDRKKDLVKLSFGEYIALGKVEAELKTYSLIENICVVANGSHNYLVALVVPNQQLLSDLAKDLGKAGLSFVEMCMDRDVVAEVTSKIRAHGTKCGLFGSELPTKIKLCPEEWLPDNGLVTAAFKLRRTIIEQHYRQAIDEMYPPSSPNGNTKSV